MTCKFTISAALLSLSLFTVTASAQEAAVESVRVFPAAVNLTTAKDRQLVVVQAVYSAGLCAAFARSTLVLIDRETRKAQPLPELLVARLERLRMKD